MVEKSRVFQKKNTSFFLQQKAARLVAINYE